MPQVSFINKDITIEVEEGTRIIDAIRRAGLKLETPCNSVGKCGKCKVRAYGDLYPKKEDEHRHTEEENIRLACVAKIKGDIQVEFINNNKSLKTINRGFSIETEIDSKFKRLSLPSIEEASPIPYKDTLKYNLKDVRVLREIGTLEKNKSKEIYSILYENNIIEIKDIKDYLLGVAVDIGTTGISAYLVDLESGEVLNKVSDLNPQTEYGSDVVSRITFCMHNEDGLTILSKCIIKKIDSMIKALVEDDYNISDIYNVVIAANTTMLHLFLGISPDSIATAPYRAVFLNELNFKANELNLDINKEGIITILPSASSYVGADIIAGVTAVDFQNKKHPSIFIDIGTNGELVAIYNGKMAASSTAAGPALEGMNISCGMRAEEGAIDTFEINEELEFSYSTIGDIKPVGVCGSGLIDVIAAFVNNNIILPTGRFNKELPEKLKERLIDKKFYITEDVYISQKDIREVQLAKGAIAAGVKMLLNEIGTSIDEIEEVVIAGAFGYHLNPESIKTLGIIPKNFSKKVLFVGNSAIEGARIALINKTKLKEMSAMKEDITVLELSTREEFQDSFISSLNF